MLKISRREFLGLVGTASLISLFGCHTSNKSDKKNMISALALQNYEFLTCKNCNMVVKYRPEVAEFTAIKLEVIDGSFEETEIFKSDIDERNDRSAIFYEEFDVINTIPANQAFEELFGSKSYYTTDEFNELVNQKNYQKVK